jgi:hypothetical protein
MPGPPTNQNGLRSHPCNPEIARCNRNSRRSERAKTTSHRRRSGSAQPQAHRTARLRRAAPFHKVEWLKQGGHEGPNTICRSAFCAPVGAVNLRLARGQIAAKILPHLISESVEFADAGLPDLDTCAKTHMPTASFTEDRSLPQTNPLRRRADSNKHAIAFRLTGSACATDRGRLRDR